jgi:signal transduction histidine kinase/CheY-like chemotaxis protein
MAGLDDVEEARRTPVASFFFPEDQSRIMDEFFPAVLERGQGETEVRFRHFKTGDARWMAYKVLTLPGADGRPAGLATVSQDVTERRRLEDDLRRVAGELSEADRRKNEFLAMLAHELRNPLAPISNAVRALRLSRGDAKAVQAASDMLERQVGQLMRLVDDLLDVSRITRGRIELRTQRIELAPIVTQAVEAVRTAYASMHHEFTVTVPATPIYLEADSTRLSQVVGNLLNNACKFTDNGGRVWVSVEQEGPQAVIRVRDNGIGVAADQLPRLFEMFTQVDASLERSRGGLGIGLTLVKTLVELQGGTVDAHSDGLGHGSEFTIRLPSLAESPALPPEPAPAPATRRRILIVDDNQDAAEWLATVLTLNGHETRVAHDGMEAIRAAERMLPDAVLLDIGLPGLDGYEVCRRIRKEPWGKNLVVVALTGWGQEEDRQKSREAGFNSHLVKPVDDEVIEKLLASLPS